MEIKIKVLFLFLKWGWGLGRGLAPSQVFTIDLQLLRHVTINIYFKSLWTNSKMKMVFLQKKRKNKDGVGLGRGLAPPKVFLVHSFKIASLPN